jgi:hypothetical protein
MKIEVVSDAKNPWWSRWGAFIVPEGMHSLNGLERESTLSYARTKDRAVAKAKVRFLKWESDRRMVIEWKR